LYNVGCEGLDLIGLAMASDT